MMVPPPMNPTTPVGRRRPISKMKKKINLKNAKDKPSLTISNTHNYRPCAHGVVLISETKTKHRSQLISACRENKISFAVKKVTRKLMKAVFQFDEFWMKF
ncbi:hypothetical protein O181_004089 [Austropuccinia psidii MF-1]|uniref:Uncharacterized protein n=1 Tax=Austropuccinia psidii MF-1 TaxID=1389203 RepID=A0A9Q3BFJ5_9BASI|nr:hypothetical protein [Austropuccinia psidii MF-1]